MKYLIGLGNPGEKYQKTRHNIGFMFLDFLKNKVENFEKWEKDSKRNIKKLKISLDGVDITLIKPLTFMNLSGIAVQKLINYHNINLKDIMVIYDDIDLELGKYRIRSKGSGGTHNGMKSVINDLGTSEITRLRIGIESRGQYAPEKQEISSFVLSKFSSEELNILNESFQEVVKNSDFKNFFI